jgi:hypothetical protein
VKQRKVPAFAVTLVLLALGVVSCTIRDNLLQSHFSKISSGMSPDQVVDIMGTPSWDGRCGAKLPTGLPAHCTREFGYAVTLAPLDDSYYLVWFGNDGRVTDTAPIISP